MIKGTKGSRKREHVNRKMKKEENSKRKRTENYNRDKMN